MAAVGVLVKTVVFDQSIYRRFGMANRWLAEMTDEFTGFAIAFAPERSGELRAGIHGDTSQVGERQIEGTIASEANHTMFVLGGTTGPIMSTKLWAAGGDPEAAFQLLWGSIDPETGTFTRRTIPGVERTLRSVGKKGFFMGVRPEPHSHYTRTTPRMFVAGQEPNNFLFKAWRATSRNHSSIRGRIPTNLFV